MGTAILLGQLKTCLAAIAKAKVLIEGRNGILARLKIQWIAKQKNHETARAVLQRTPIFDASRWRFLRHSPALYLRRERDQRVLRSSAPDTKDTMSVDHCGPPRAPMAIFIGKRT